MGQFFGLWVSWVICAASLGQVSSFVARRMCLFELIRSKKKNKTSPPVRSTCYRIGPLGILASHQSKKRRISWSGLPLASWMEGRRKTEQKGLACLKKSIPYKFPHISCAQAPFRLRNRARKHLRTPRVVCNRYLRVCQALARGLIRAMHASPLSFPGGIAHTLSFFQLVFLFFSTFSRTQ